MLLAQHPLAGLERAPIERLGFGVAALVLIERGQIVHNRQRTAVLLAQHPLTSLERAPIERPGFGVAALVLKEQGEIVHALKRIGVLLAQHPLAGLERTLIERRGCGGRRSRFRARKQRLAAAGSLPNTGSCISQPTA